MKKNKVVMLFVTLLSLFMVSFSTRDNLQKTDSTLKITHLDGSDVNEDEVLITTPSSLRVIEIKKSGDYLIQGDKNAVKEKIKVNENFNGSLTLKDVNLNVTNMYDGAPIEINNSATITLFIEGENTISPPQYHPGIDFSGNLDEGDFLGQLTIDSKNNGTLNISGAMNDASCIGAPSKIIKENHQDVANITINGGNINTYTIGIGGASIGSAANGDVKNLVINGGNINADVYSNDNGGASIGSGQSGKVISLTINGGNINASLNKKNKNEGRSSAIGSGVYGSVEKITINGGNINTSTQIGTGIGTGFTYKKNTSEITINGGTITTTSKNGDLSSIGTTNIENVNEKIIVNGGSIKTKSFTSALHNNNGDELELLTLEEVNDFKEIFVDGNKMNIEKSNDQNLYLYLTKANHQIKIVNQNGETSYSANWNGSNFDIKNDSLLTNEWIVYPTISDYKINEKPSTPVAQSKYGEVIFSYSVNKEGPYNDILPKTVGTYFMKAHVNAYENYSSLEAIVSFNVLKGDTNISIENSLNKTYDGSKIDEPKFNVIGSNGKVSLNYYQKKNDKYVLMTNEPINAGEYKLEIIVEEDENYLGEKSVTEFTIFKAVNEWVEVPSVNDIKVGEEIVINGSSLYGEINYSFSSSQNGEYVEKIPSQKGHYFVKVIVNETENYNGLEMILSFDIVEKTPPTKTVNPFMIVAAITVVVIVSFGLYLAIKAIKK
ncbi:MAG: hypothetical protein SO253_00575 [Bacilli bacterium]|nr:hypothetical protein [Bacilli bacterium]